MVILFVIKRFDFGGAENYTADLANTLSDKGHSIIIIARNGKQIAKLKPNIRFIAVSRIQRSLPFQVQLIADTVKKYRVDVVHAHQRFAIQAASLAGKISNIPVVATIHGRTKFDLKSKFARKHLSRLIFISKQVLDKTKYHDQIAHKSVVIPNGHHFLHIERQPQPQQILYASRIDKSHFELLKLLVTHVLPMLYEAFPTVVLRIAGDGKYQEKLIKLCRDTNLKIEKDVCVLTGYNKSINQAIATSSVVLGVGRVALEAAGMGAPLLIVNKKHMGQMLNLDYYQKVKKNNFVAVDAEAPTAEALFDQIHKALANDVYYENQAREIQKLVKEEFGLNQLSEAILGIYAEVLS